MCKFESSQKDESGAEQADSSQASHKPIPCFIILKLTTVATIPNTVQ